jgi:hypothetical protein
MVLAIVLRALRDTYGATKAFYLYIQRNLRLLEFLTLTRRLFYVNSIFIFLFFWTNMNHLTLT